MTLTNRVYDEKSRTYGALPWVKDEAALALLSAMIRDMKVDTVIDLGCGPASLARFCKDKGIYCRYVGVDCSSYMLSEAVANNIGDPLVQFLNEEINSEMFQLNCINSVLLLKNVLHLIPNYIEFLRRLPARFPNSQHLLIVETVSPDCECLEWVQGLFLRLGSQYKSNWFVRDEFRYAIEESFVAPVTCDLYEQTIDVDKWLESFGVNEFNRSLLDAYFNEIPVDVRRKMNYRNKHGTRTMLRLQMVLKFSLI